MKDVHKPQRPTGWWPRSGRDPDDGDLFAASVGPDARWTEDLRDDESTRADTADPVPAPRGPARGDGPVHPGGPAHPGDATPGFEELLARLAAAERAREVAEHALEEARHRADALAAALDDARAHPPETFGMRADKVLRMAEHDAAQRRRAAEAEAEALVERARSDAERITSEARTEAAGITAVAQADVDRLRAAGDEARRDSELVADTAASMHAHVSDLRGTVRDEVARLHALLGAELGRLDGPARVLRRAGAGHVVGSPGTGAAARWAVNPPGIVPPVPAAGEAPATDGDDADGSDGAGDERAGRSGNAAAADDSRGPAHALTGRAPEPLPESSDEATPPDGGAAAAGAGSAPPIVLPEQRAADRVAPQSPAADTDAPDGSAAPGDGDDDPGREHRPVDGVRGGAGV
ncbi:hypothetical protein ACLFMI_10475 [Pseudonocardia nantongensis]|uniref:hypothetical protein n=1 Tax=Pseudonocardia nantongensis TaxID=1181885 RepID=UPI00397D35BF